jgi:trimeric autotransporter adhesin
VKQIHIEIILVLLLCTTLGHAQTVSSNIPVPPLVKFSGVLNDVNGKPLTGIVGVTFSLYKEDHGGAALWMETQNVRLNESGHYTVLLGASSSSGLPPDIFASGEARWLAVQVADQAEQTRVLLAAVPYAMKAADAETIRGLPPSAFVLAVQPRAEATSSATDSPGSNIGLALTTVTGAGTLNFLPIWTGASTLGNSVLFQTGGKVGINTTAPTTTLDVKGAATVRGQLLLPAMGTATATAGFTSQGEELVASAFNSSTKLAVNENFRWVAEPAANNTTAPSATLNLQFSSGAATPTETGLKITSNGRITFATGQTFPGTGSGTIKGVTAGTDLTGGGSSGIVTLALDTTKVPQLNSANTFSQLQTINNQVSIKSTIGGQALIATGTGGPSGIQGGTDSTGGAGVVGVATAITGNATGVVGASNGPTGTGGRFSGAVGVLGQSLICCSGFGGEFAGANAPSGSGASGTLGVLGLGGNGDIATSSDGIGGEFQGGNKGIHGDGIDAIAGSGLAGNFSGNLNVSGVITAGTKDFKIDHPLDPANKYLVHASVESSEMMNIYTGNVITDVRGEAVIKLPDWFETLNSDFSLSANGDRPVCPSHCE